jgi:hypothetical protein
MKDRRKRRNSEERLFFCRNQKRPIDQLLLHSFTWVLAHLTEPRTNLQIHALNNPLIHLSKRLLSWLHAATSLSHLSSDQTIPFLDKSTSPSAYLLIHPPINPHSGIFFETSAIFQRNIKPSIDSQIYYFSHPFAHLHIHSSVSIAYKHSGSAKWIGYWKVVTEDVPANATK